MNDFDPTKDFVPVNANNAPAQGSEFFSSVEQPKQKTAAGKALRAIGQFGVGIGKGAVDTIASVPRNIKKVGDAAYDVVVEKKFTEAIELINKQNNALVDAMKRLPTDDPRRAKYGDLIRQNNQQIQAIRGDAGAAREGYEVGSGVITGLDKVATPTNKAQSAGFATEKVAEFFVPAAQVAKADKVFNGMKVVSDTMKGGKVINATTRILGKAGTEGAAVAATSLAQSGYQGLFDSKEGTKEAFKDAKNAGLTAGVLKGAFAGFGELARGGNIPKKLYTQVYKETDRTGEAWFKNAGTGKNTSTTADWALNKGIKGSLENQAKQVRAILEKSEDDVVNAAERSGARVDVPPNLKNLALKLKEEYADYGRGEITAKVDDFIKDIGKDGTMSVRKALDLRRFLDKLRTKTSFRNPKIGDDIAYWADDLRGQVNKINDIGQINKDYAFAIQAKDALIRAARSLNNQKVLGAFEGYFEGGAMLAGKPLEGAAIIGAKRLTQSPNIQSRVAQGLNKIGDSTKKGIVTRAFLGKKVADSQDENFISP